MAAQPELTGSHRHGVYAPPPSGADDTDQLQRAIDRAAEAGSEVVLAAGTYQLSRVILVTKPVSIRGQGIHRTTLLWKDGAGSMPGRNSPREGSGLISLRHVDGLYIRDLHIDCNRTGNPKADLNGIYGLGCADVVVEGVRVDRVRANFNGEFGNGMRFVSDGDKRCERIRVSRCRVTDVVMSHAIQFSLHPRHCIVTENDISDCTHGIDMSTGFFNAVANNLVDRCNSSPHSVAIAVTSAARMTIIGNVISECSIGILGRMGDMAITGNYLHGMGPEVGAGICLTNGRHHPRTIGSNFIEQFATAVELTDTANVAVTGNTIHDCALGVDLRRETVRTSIVANVFSGVGNAVRAGDQSKLTSVVANNASAAMEDAYGRNGLTAENLRGA